MSLFGGFFGSGSGSGSNSSLFGSGGLFDDQKKPAGTQYNVDGTFRNNEQEVRDTINRRSGWGSLGGRCQYCGYYISNKADLLDHEARCTYRK